MTGGGEIWDIEEGFWTGPRSHYEKYMHTDCLMVFPEPAGIMQGAAIVENLSDDARWRDVAISERRTAEMDGGTRVLANFAEATRGEGETYRARCSSTYLREDNVWRMIQHQHTPEE